MTKLIFSQEMDPDKYLRMCQFLLDRFDELKLGVQLTATTQALTQINRKALQAADINFDYHRVLQQRSEIAVVPVYLVIEFDDPELAILFKMSFA